MANRVAIYPGTFDPITLGHVDVIERGSRLFDRLIVAMAVNIEKAPLFSVEEREEMIKETLVQRGIANVDVVQFEGMIVDFVKAQGSHVLLRGIRTLSDFESEFQMALTNRELARDVETVFVMASLEYSFVSSRLIREVAALGGGVSRFVPPASERMLKTRFKVRSSPSA